MDAYRPTLIPVYVASTLTTGQKFAMRMPVSGRIYEVVAEVGTAPTGATAIVDVEIEGTSVFAATGDRPTVATSGTVATVGSIGAEGKFDAGELVTVDVDQIGSTVAGADLALTLVVVTDY
jgi:hypothetical protein